MSHDKPLRIDADAAKALAEWKAIFGRQVIQKATDRAISAGAAITVTRHHFREAAAEVIQELNAVIQDTDLNDGRQQAA